MIKVQRPRPAFKLWLETDEGYVFGPGVYSLLRKIQEKGTLKEAAASLGMSYRFAWGLLKKAEEKLGEPLISASKGGRHGGGSTEITELGSQYVDEFERFRMMLEEVSGSTDLGARVQGTVIKVREMGETKELVLRLQGESTCISVPGDATVRVGDKLTLRVRLET
ncbi:LysR family transcriptional regulator [Candidatus Bathyarchaeota archaeon]|nr:LysR family transcriptional regulator [Candidatus Bathyarchaeota archaeon]